MILNKIKYFRLAMFVLIGVMIGIDPDFQTDLNGRITLIATVAGAIKSFFPAK